MECELNLKLQRKKVSPKEELYNLKDKSCQEIFKEYTNTTKMAKIFDSDKNIDLLAKKFINILDGTIIKCFNKVRNTKGRDAQLVKLYSKRQTLKKHIDDKHKVGITEVEKFIAEEACKIIDEETAGLESETGGYNAGHLWKLKKIRSYLNQHKFLQQ